MRTAPLDTEASKQRVSRGQASHIVGFEILTTTGRHALPHLRLKAVMHNERTELKHREGYYTIT